MQLGDASLLPHSPSERDGLIAKDFCSADIDEGRRQAREILCPSRRRVSLNGGGPPTVSEISLPPGFVAASIPYALSLHLTTRDGLVAVVEHWVNQQLPSRKGEILIAKLQAKASCEPASGTCTCNDDASRIDPEHFGVLESPEVTRQTVIMCRRIRILGGQPVIDRDDRDSKFLRPTCVLRCSAKTISHKHAASMNEEDGWSRSCTVVR
jgi:hypothetical protein